MTHFPHFEQLDRRGRDPRQGFEHVAVKVDHGRQQSEQRALDVLASASSKDNCGLC